MGGVLVLVQLVLRVEGRVACRTAIAETKFNIFIPYLKVRQYEKTAAS